jgi:hypothetical protein
MCEISFKQCLEDRHTSEIKTRAYISETVDGILCELIICYVQKCVDCAKVIPDNSFVCFV